MKKKYDMKTLILFFFVITVIKLNGQSLENSLNSAYNNFNDAAIDSLLDKASAGADSLSPADRVAFHKYNAFRAFRNNQAEQVNLHFRQLIAINPAYTLDPVTTSPKLIMVFDKAKIEYLEAQQKRLYELAQSPATAPFPWRSLAFPGWEQWHRGAQTKGIAWGAAGLITLAGTLQAVYRTAAARQDYLDAADTQAAGRKYKVYNRLYRSQYYWVYGLCTVWVASYFDAVYLTESSRLVISLEAADAETPAISVSVHF